MSGDLMTTDEFRALLFPDFQPGKHAPSIGTVLVVRRKSHWYEKALGRACALYVVWKAVRS